MVPGGALAPPECLAANETRRRRAWSHLTTPHERPLSGRDEVECNAGATGGDKGLLVDNKLFVDVGVAVPNVARRACRPDCLDSLIVQCTLAPVNPDKRST